MHFYATIFESWGSNCTPCTPGCAATGKYILIFCLFQVLEWIVKQKTESLIEEVTDAILEELIKEHEYVAVYFRGDCANNKEVDCDEILADLETIDEDLDEIGIMLVTTKDNQVAIDNGR